MRNAYPGTCYRCGARVEPGDGHFERFRGGWRTQHASCAIKFRGVPDQERQKDRASLDAALAQGTGKKAQNARRRLRDADRMRITASDMLPAIEAPRED